ncbi:HAMP domain-containing sensor histidine kinase [Saccharibacillus alkalitolerans]|uniref:histidine kinase n=1 Tax=Saccharibacillus alkalitolerans TaxID=2705290 RepID=A0ABX0F495_9BACL|nr:HAMP domain-containing sensor histidine kinase [Saccharibacillus alkalitolerans]NGZ75786.1 HAMP domain-containing histidine kinase [Saccharibacillus alkalitolerans]
MSLLSAFRRGTAAALLLLLAAFGLGVWLLSAAGGAGAPDGRPVVNRARVLTSPILEELERLQPGAPYAAAPSEIDRLSREANASLVYVGTDGKVRFDTSGALPPGSLFDLKHGLHYDLHASRANPGRYAIAFPVVSDSGAVSGHALFTLRAEDVLPPEDRLPFVLTSALFLCLTAVSLLLLAYLRMFKVRVFRPLEELRFHTEQILKGDAGQSIEHGRVDEVGSLYASFDRMRLEIRHLNDRRDRQEQAQRELVSGISHDLKTPLATMRAYMEAILAGLCPSMEKVTEYISVMNRHADKMTRLIDDLLLHALKELGQISVEPRERYSREVFGPMLQTAAHRIETSGRIFAGPSEPPNLLIRADAFRLEQVVFNLLANALKHTRSGDTVGLSFEEIPGYLRISLSDTGSGIRPEDMPFVFERYYKGNTEDIDGAPNPGSGLGLAICKQIVEAHGGSIAFRSLPGRETVFHFTVPLC